MLLHGKVAIVTGASQGIGRGIAIVLAREGANVVVNSRNLDRAQAVAREIAASDGTAAAFAADVTNRREVESMVEATLEIVCSLFT